MLAKKESNITNFKTEDIELTHKDYDSPDSRLITFQQQVQILQL